MSESKYKPIIERAVEEIYLLYPGLDEQFGERGRIKCYEDNVHHFTYLETAANIKNSKVFVDYALWLDSVLTSRGMKTDHLIDNFKSIIKALDVTEIEKETEELFTQYLHEAIEHLSKPS